MDATYDELELLFDGQGVLLGVFLARDGWGERPVWGRQQPIQETPQSAGVYVVIESLVGRPTYGFRAGRAG